MILSNGKWTPEDSDDGLHVDWLRIKLEEFDYFTVETYEGYRIDIFNAFINVATPGTERHVDGEKVWQRPA